MDMIKSMVGSNPEVVEQAGKKAGQMVEQAVKSALSGNDGQKGQTEAGGQAGVKVKGQAGGAEAKVEGEGGFGLDDALSAIGGKKENKEGGSKGFLGSFGL
ncbi:uncharacterized protein LOC101172678 [Oryzias latipes]|uniref:uncharacterized protein LOC101172678 n=1 Tax=Oryzias latipes TaxID=8090 RepID=UPI0000EA1177|nr:uncharacterized protein LOC101172678 [Oryzias latipes]